MTISMLVEIDDDQATVSGVNDETQQHTPRKTTVATTATDLVSSETVLCRPFASSLFTLKIDRKILSSSLFVMSPDRDL